MVHLEIVGDSMVIKLDTKPHTYMKRLCVKFGEFSLCLCCKHNIPAIVICNQVGNKKTVFFDSVELCLPNFTHRIIVICIITYFIFVLGEAFFQ
jgi:hypothetical protein